MSGNVLYEIFILFLSILLAPIVSRISKIPVIVIEIIFGIILGGSFLCFLGYSDWLSAMALIGFIYLMFVVGLEVDFALLKSHFLKVILITFGSLFTPFLLGFFVAILFDLPPLFIGVALSTTSMGVILPTIKELDTSEEFNNVLLGSAILVDIISMFALAFIIEEEILSTDRLVLLMLTLVCSLLGIYLLKRTSLVEKITLCGREYHFDVRLSLALIFGFAILAEFVGVHAILGSFFAGLFISEFEEKVESLIEKLLSFGYGFFIPVFFISVGVRTDISIIFTSLENLGILAALLLAGFLGKFFGTSLIAKYIGFDKYESMSMGFAMSARLSLIIAAAELGLATGIIGVDIYSVFVLLAISSILLSPSLAKLVIGRRAVVIKEESAVL